MARCRETGLDTALVAVESVAELARDAPLLLLCMARPELLELRPSWGGGIWNATTVLLEPLDAAETAELFEALGGVDEELAMRIAANADARDTALRRGDAGARSQRPGWAVDVPTLSRCWQPDSTSSTQASRAVLERGSIDWQVFHRGSVEALANGEPQADRLMALVRKQLVRPDRPQLPNDDAYRFRHLLIRDAAYDALPKSVRADLHRRFARWLETHGRDLVELEEITCYHYEQAARYLAELGRPRSALTVP
jgi:hypothetical protein